MSHWTRTGWPLIALLCGHLVIGRGAAAETESPPAADETARSEAAAPLSTPESEEEPGARLLERLRKERPEEFTRLEWLRQRDPEAFRAEWQRRLKKRFEGRAEGNPSGHPPPLRPLDDDPELSQELLALAERYRATSDPSEKNALRQRMRERIEAAFRPRDEAWQAKLAAARRELEELERRFDQWRRVRAGLIERRIERLLQDSTDSAKNPQTP